MNVRLEGVNLPISPSLKSYLLNKTSKINKHFIYHCDLEFTLLVDNKAHKIEVKAHTLGKNIYCDYACSDMYQAIDKVLWRLDRILLKLKDKLVNHNHLLSVKREVYSA